MLRSRVGTWPYPQTIDKAGKGLPGKNALAYLAHLEGTKSFLNAAPGVCRGRHSIESSGKELQLPNLPWQLSNCDTGIEQTISVLNETVRYVIEIGSNFGAFKSLIFLMFRVLTKFGKNS